MQLEKQFNYIKEEALIYNNWENYKKQMQEFELLSRKNCSRESNFGIT